MQTDNNTTVGYIEPEGFKGTKGEWRNSELMNFSDTLVSFIASHHKPVAQLRGCLNGEEIEAEANAILLSSSKELVKALQDIIKWHKEHIAISFIEDDIIDNAEQVLNKALNIQP